MASNSFLTRLYKYLGSNTTAIYIALTLYWVILFVLTSIPAKNMPSLEISDKLEHFGAYLLLAFLLRLALHFQKKYLFTYKQIIIITSVIGVVYGFFDELHQFLIPGRFFDWYDLLANTIGIILGLILSEIFIKYSR